MTFDRAQLVADLERDEGVRLSDCSGVAPSTVKPSADSGCLDPALSRRLCDREAIAVYHNVSVPSRIVVLLHPARPSTVVWAIWTIVVDAVKRVTGRTLTHVHKELGKIIAPLVAHRDSSPPVARVVLQAHVVATLFRLRPCAMFWRASAPMNKVAAEPQASTTKRVTSAQNVCADSLGFAAIALAFPARGPSPWGRWSHGNKATKPLTRQIERLFHSTHYIALAEHATCL